MTYAKSVGGKKMGRQVVSAAEDFHAQVHYWKGRHDKVRDLLAAVAANRCYNIRMSNSTAYDNANEHTGSIETCQSIMCAEAWKLCAAEEESGG